MSDDGQLTCDDCGIRDDGQLGLVSHHSWIRTKPSHIECVAIYIEPAMQECRGCSSGSCTGSNCDDGWMAASVDDNMGGDHRRTAIKQSGVDEHGSDRISECDSGGSGSYTASCGYSGRVRMVGTLESTLWTSDSSVRSKAGGTGASTSRIVEATTQRVCVEHDECNESGCTVEQQCCTVQWSLDGMSVSIVGASTMALSTRLEWCGSVGTKSEGSAWTSDCLFAPRWVGAVPAGPHGNRTGASECGSADWHGNWSVDVQCTSTKQWNGEQWTDHR